MMLSTCVVGAAGPWSGLRCPDARSCPETAWNGPLAAPSAREMWPLVAPLRTESTSGLKILVVAYIIPSTKGVIISSKSILITQI